MAPRNAVRARLMARIIREDGAWAALYARLQAAYTRAWTLGWQAAARAALERLRGMAPGPFSARDAQRILTQFEHAVGPEAMTRLLAGPVVRLDEALYRLGQTEVGQSTGVDIGFGRPDRAALKILSQGNLYWVGNSWNTHTQALLDNALKDYFDQGLTRAQLAARFQADFAGLGERGAHYWELLADHAATKTREMGRVSGYERAAVDAVQVRAHLDERTTPICRSLHGRIIPVSRLRAQTDAYLAAIQRRDLEAAKASWVMHPDQADLAGHRTQELPAGTAAPPYHFRCRTITVAYFGGSGGELRYGGRLRPAERQAVDAKTPAEHRAVVDSLRALARANRLHYATDQLQADLRKGDASGLVRLLRHAVDEFGLQGTPEAVAEAYRALGNRIVATGERVFVRQVAPHGLQYVWAAAQERGFAVVDQNTTRLYGVFGHATAAGFDRATQAWLGAHGAELGAG